MAPSASIVVPTRDRPGYLEVALASVAPQARAAGAEIVVAEDGSGDGATAEVAARHGARHVCTGAPRGPNAARNAGVAAGAGDVLVFLDDDVEADPGWLDALLAAVREHSEHDAFGGPIRPRLEGVRLPLCGRESGPVTTLDLGPEDRDADLVWSANMAVRRSALERVGPFDATLDIYGDEEDWQRRLKASGGRIRYVAAAGVDHRRSGRDARLSGLCRAAYRRGRNSRRYDARKRSLPPLQAEVRVLAGCLWHAPRRRCANGIVMAAHGAGRIREALLPRPPGPREGDPDWASGESGTLNRRSATLGAALDLVFDTVTLPRRLALHRAARRGPRCRVLAVSIARPELAGAAAAAGRELERSRHEVHVRLAAPQPGAGKWRNLNDALDANPPAGYDWLLIFDDDVVLSQGFLDPFLFLAERFDLTLAQPAHKRWSNTSWRVTRRRLGSVARVTRFVEIGPVTAIHARAFETLLPFPDLHMGWGLDAHWAALAQEHGWRIGVIDATAMRHTRPVAAAYRHAEALEESRAWLAKRPHVTSAEAQQTVATYRSWRG